MSFPLLVAAMALAAAMGFAIQRGATCTVAAVEEWVREGRVSRLGAMLEASLWVAFGLIVLGELSLTGPLPRGAAIGTATFAGAVLLGAGAWVNRACVFGAVARLGNGELAYLATLPGFLLGCVLAQPWLPPSASVASPLEGAATVVAFPLGLFLLYRLWGVLRRPAWSPHVATGVIGVTFLALLVTMGAWAYTDVLADIARGEVANLPSRGALLVALFCGAMAGGLAAGQFRIRVGGVGRCLAGGTLMGAGSVLLPGSNDGILLLGVPLLFPHAWLAFAIMFATIWVAMRASRR